MKIKYIQGSEWAKIRDKYTLHAFTLYHDQITGLYRRVIGRDGQKMIYHKLTEQEIYDFKNTYGYYAALSNVVCTEKGVEYYLPGEKRSPKKSTKKIPKKH